MTAALHVVDLILNFLFLHCGYLGAFVYLFILPKHWHLENLSYIKKQQEQAEAQNKTMSPSPVPLGATANIADRRSPSPSTECPKNHIEVPKTLLSDCPLTRACWKCNAYALGAWRVRVGVRTCTR